MDVFDINKPISISIELIESDEEDNLFIKAKSLPLIETDVVKEEDNLINKAKSLPLIKTDVVKEEDNLINKAKSLPLIKTDVVEEEDNLFIKAKSLPLIETYVVKEEDNLINKAKSLPLIKTDVVEEEDNLFIKAKSLPLIETYVVEETKAISNKGSHDTCACDLNKNRKRSLIFKNDTNIISKNAESQDNDESKRNNAKIKKMGNVVFENLINNYCNANLPDLNNIITNKDVSSTTDIKCTNSVHTDIGFRCDNNNENGAIAEKVNINNRDLLKSLRRVSDILISVTELHNHVNTKDDKIREEDTQKLKQNFLDMKYHYFSLSYDTIVSLFLSLVKNETFVNSFLSDTMKFAKEYRKINCSYGTLKLLFYEMVKWSKEKQNQFELPTHIRKMDHKKKYRPPSSAYKRNKKACDHITTASVSQTNNGNHALLRQHLNNTLPSNEGSTNTPNNMMNRVANVRVKQRNEVRPTVTRKYPNSMSRNNINAVQNKTHYKSSSNIGRSNHGDAKTLIDYLNSPTLSNRNSINRLGHRVNMSGTHTVANTNMIQGNNFSNPITVSNINNGYVNHSNTIQNEASNNITQSNNFVIDRNIPQNNLNHVIATDNVLNTPTTCIFSSGPSEPMLTVNVDSSLLKKYTHGNPPCTAPTKTSACSRHGNDLQGSMYSNRSQNSCQYNMTQNSQIENLIPKPPSYYEWCSRNRAQTTTTQNHYSTIQIQQEDHAEHKPIQNDYETTRHSLSSTDSGFVSPLNFNTAVDQTNIFPAKQIKEFSPTITHVTSLNPDASFSLYGACYVCGRNTNQKCLGCLQYYYCSYACQISDWCYHMLLCGKQSI